MRNNFETLSIFLFAGAAVLLLAVQLFNLKEYDFSENPEKNIQTKQGQEMVLEGIKELYRLWSVGDLEGEWEEGKLSCQDILGEHKNVHRSYLSCNPGLIECYGRLGKELRFKYQGNTFHLRFKQSFSNNDGNKKYYRWVNRAQYSGHQLPASGVQVDLEIKERSGFSQSIVLSDICHESFLPQNIYAYGPYVSGRLRKGASEWLWDNQDRFIYIDKFQVSNRDVKDWIDYGKGPVQLLKDMNGKVLAAPATHLTRDQMKQYCEFHGKSIMQAHVFDAATFKNIENRRYNDGEYFRAMYPWSEKDNEGFLAKIKVTPDYEITQEDCANAYVYECLEKFPYIHHARANPSWMGIYQMLGGYLEYMENNIEPIKNLLVSSFYFPVNSPWHQLGKRIHWDGQGHTSNHFEQGILPDIDDDYEVAFRCMREVDRAL